MSHLGHQTVASLLKSKPPVPYANMLRQVTNHIKKLQEELEAESSTNIEFEESSRRSFEFLTQQLKALKQAFNTLSDTLLEEYRQSLFCRPVDRQPKSLFCWLPWPTMPFFQEEKYLLPYYSNLIPEYNCRR